MFYALLKTMRPKQWAKNGFIFVPLIFDRKLNHLDVGATALGGFLVFCLLASTIYIINDLSDLEADRRHPRKKLRPLASGQLQVPAAITTAAVLLLIAFPAAFFLNINFFILCVIYFISNLVYSQWLKHVPLLDVLLLAMFYVVRVAAGVALIDVERFSPWLYLFTTFIALFLGIGKRRAELSLMSESAGSTRKVLRGYTLPFLDQLIIVVSTLTIITYSLYTFSAVNLPENNAMMLTIPFLIYGLFRYLYIVHVEDSGEAPEEVLFKDRPLQISLLLFGASILIIFYLF
jgi:4-hydroxybenzoate polyprenyltransferase